MYLNLVKKAFKGSISLRAFCHLTWQENCQPFSSACRAKMAKALFLVKISVHINIKKIQTNCNVEILGGYHG
ncbi:hypothetical protein ABE61_16570 [Lysinibacillus sphaericus]|nr:hypothetical protein [Lysinibacillus sphaericus]MBG9478047.1 hypothetical protein [Lysinibacillus sphaericus]MBG9594187.1 hypothetical protein [Lysinibacillus sphaericus]